MVSIFGSETNSGASVQRNLVKKPVMRIDTLLSAISFDNGRAPQRIDMHDMACHKPTVRNLIFQSALSVIKIEPPTPRTL